MMLLLIKFCTKFINQTQIRQCLTNIGFKGKIQGQSGLTDNMTQPII